MEPMELDIAESPKYDKNGEQSSSECSEMEVDMSPSCFYNGNTIKSELNTPRSSNSRVVDDSTYSGQYATNKSFKTGYGIPEDDTTFSHFPEKSLTKSDTLLVQRKHNLKEPAGVSDANKVSNEHSGVGGTQKVSSIGSCCYLLFKLLILIAGISTFTVIAVYFIQAHKQKCLASRQFEREALLTDLQSFVFGQSLVSATIPDQIEAYFTKLNSKTDLLNAEENRTHRDDDVFASHESHISCKPLVLSFHGWTGVGKNFVSKIISNTFSGATTTHIVIPLHFPHKSTENKYKEEIKNWIVTNNTACTVNIVIIDEMDKAFPPISEGIVDAVEALTVPCVRSTPTIIILLSNSYATEINRLFFKALEDSPSITRQQIQMSTFYPVFTSPAEDYWSRLLVDKSIVDSFIPFLPLEKSHVVQCVKRELVSRRLSTDAETVNKVLPELTFTSYAGLEVSTTGCKRVADKIDYVMLGR